jgi:hypothetical protein
MESDMYGSRISSFKYVGLALLGVGGFFACAKPSRHVPSGTGNLISAQLRAIQPLSSNDVSLLFPAPMRAEDFAKLIAVADLTTQDPQDPTKRDPIWPDAVFQQFVAIANGAQSQVAGTQSRIGLPAEAQSINAWFISGIRIDGGAPGLSSEIRDQFGQSPEIRLIVQPVTRKPDGTPVVHDIAGHLIFDFRLGPAATPVPAGCFTQQVPDIDALESIVADLASLRTKLSQGRLGTNKVTTAGIPLGVHPGLVDITTANSFREEIKAFLERHISAQRLDAMAIAGLPAGAPAPWIFLSMQEVPPGLIPALPKGGFVPVHGPTLDGQQFAQLLQPVGTSPRVVPPPHTNNLNPITCNNAAVSPASLPIDKRNGVATADLFVTPVPSAAKIKATLDVIADPDRSHFFNTDCISCHTETRRAMELLNVKDFPGVNSAALPNGSWNVRNFGWSPGGGSAQATVTRRTAAETAAVVSFVNSQLLAKQ